MFLNKKTIRPVGKGTFCVIPEDLRNKMKQTESYQREGNSSGYSYHKTLHIADADVLYVADDKVFDKEGLMRVLPITFFGSNYWAEKAELCSRKGYSFLVDRSKLQLLVSNWRERESVENVHHQRLRAICNQYNDKFNLDGKLIPIKWEDN